MSRPFVPESRLDLSADRACALAMNPVSGETAARLDRFVDVLLHWQRRANLVSSSTLPCLWTRHVADSLQLVPLVPGARVFVDLGSGGGFPGMVIACAIAGNPERPAARVHLVASNAKKAAFLRHATRAAAVPAVIYHGRIEEFVRHFTGKVDVVTARALAPLPKLLGLAEPLLKRGAKGLFLKGQDVDAELTEASKCWSIDATFKPSMTDAGGRIVLIRHAYRHPPGRSNERAGDKPSGRAQ
jgi:16S rRNA (guanine527-N7)-methyltransferase